MKSRLHIVFMVVLLATTQYMSAQDGAEVALVGNYLSYHGNNHLGDAVTSANRGAGLNVRAGSKSFIIDMGINYNHVNISGSPIFRSGAGAMMRDVTLGVGYRLVLSRLWEADITYHVAISRLRSTIDMHGTAHGPMMRLNFAARQPLSPMVFLEAGFWMGTFDQLRAPEGFERYYRRYRASLVRIGVGYRFGSETAARLREVAE